MTQEPLGTIPDPRAPGDTAAEKAKSPQLVMQQDLANLHNAIPAGMDEEGFDAMTKDVSPGGDTFERIRAFVTGPDTPGDAYQSGYSYFDNLLITNARAAGLVAGWDGGEVKVAANALAYIAALSPGEREHMMAAAAAAGQAP